MELKLLIHTTARWQIGEIDDASYAGLYFLHWQVASHGRRFASRRCRFDPKPDPVAWFEDTLDLEREAVRGYLIRYFDRYQFLGVIANVPVALAAWLKGEWPLTLCGHIPDVRTVLAMQVEGKRPVTVLSAWPRMLSPVLAKANAFAFMVHDLEHAFKFFHHPELHGQQREFFRLLHQALNLGLFDGYLQDSVFSAKFDYLASDMNTHFMHACQYLRAILVEFHLRREGLREHDRLSRGAREQVSGLLAHMLGAEWPPGLEGRSL